jgi:uncharacterized protein (DUF1501 family)
MAISRRTLLQRGGLLAAGTAVWPSWMPRMVFRNQDSPQRGDVLVVVFARGGFDGLNMVIPYMEEGRYRALRPTIAIPGPDDAAPGRALDLDGKFAMHPALAASNMGNWLEWYQDGKLAIVHAMHMADPTRSHFDAQDFMERGTPGNKNLNSGWLGRHLTVMASENKSPFRAVGMGTMVQAALRGPIPAVALQSIADFHLQGRQNEIARFQQHLAELYAGDGWLDVEGQATFDAIDMLAKSGAANGTYQPAHGARYGADGFHRGLQQIAQLVKADVGLEVACIDIGGWDTHANQVVAGNTTTGSMANLMSSLAGGISAFLTDLTDYASTPGVTVAVMSEFGRRAGENGGRGTDHGHGNVMFVLGSGINGGKVYANWPGLAEDKLDRGDLAGTTEYRDVLGELLSKRVGNSKITDVFPNHSFNFLGLAQARDTTVPTPEPTVQPTAVPTVAPTNVPPPTGSKVYLPFANK